MMRFVVLLALFVAACGGVHQEAVPCVTSGHPQRQGQTITVTDPITRIVWDGQRGDYAGIVVSWEPLNGEPVRSASGGVLRQVGLMLDVRDPCNATYVMWRESGINVLKKSNPGLTSFSECGAGGYTVYARNIKPGENAGKLEARISGMALTVFVDGVEVWSRLVALYGGGAAGFRSDNVAAEFDWLGGRLGGVTRQDCAGYL